MLQCPFISIIVFKDPDRKLGHIATTNSTCTQVTLSLMDGGLSTTRPTNSPLCVSLNIHSKYLRLPLWVPQRTDNMLQCSFISTIIFKDLDRKLGHIATTNSTCTQVTLSLMDGGLSTTRPTNSPLCVSLCIHSKYRRVPLWVPHNVQGMSIYMYWDELEWNLN
jgi:hypothetical protein